MLYPFSGGAAVYCPFYIWYTREISGVNKLTSLSYGINSPGAALSWEIHPGAAPPKVKGTL